ncbi:MAG: hypothetical protein IM584_06125 [Chitinophagaceae bacterium]|nr:hypothetical protein [Chitinophagaceae bacterium]MCA6454185.1 hypothetical protein [Chitinophagaceae bacterium]MCA6455695.1 hypothetical protein [Chitinophagaceae bacterium]MCA6459519.1 hypothetical protein [Chitinophagaceae bacterium]MCA6464677.1 hypothetical protein [Chitinophagaceae bacterium]
MSITAVAILENPRAGKGRSAAVATWLHNELEKRQIPSTIYKDEWPLELAGFSDAWLIGGDGTINYFINRYPDCDKALALFKSGTGNDFAWKLYGNKTNAEQLEQVLQATPRCIDAGRFNEHLFINCLGLGFDGEIVRSMGSIRMLGGKLGYLLAVVTKIFRFREKRFTIQAGTEKWQGPYLLVMVVNSSRAGGGFFVAPEASVEDGSLDMVLCEPLTMFKRLRYLPVIQKGKHLHLPFVTHRQGYEFRISCYEAVDIQADGDLYRAKDLTIEVLPGKFRFRY